MPKFVIYEIWSRSRVVESASAKTVYQENDPDPKLTAQHGLNLGNWHAVRVGDDTPVTEFIDK